MTPAEIAARVREMTERERLAARVEELERDIAALRRANLSASAMALGQTSRLAAWSGVAERMAGALRGMLGRYGIHSNGEIKAAGDALAAYERMRKDDAK